MADEQAMEYATLFGDEGVDFDPQQMTRFLTGKAIGQMMANRYIQQKRTQDLTYAFGLDPRIIMQSRQLEDAERDRRMAFQQQQTSNYMRGAQLAGGIPDMVTVKNPQTGEPMSIRRDQLLQYYGLMQRGQDTGGYPKAYNQYLTDLASGDPGRIARANEYVRFQQSMSGVGPQTQLQEDILSIDFGKKMLDLVDPREYQKRYTTNKDKYPNGPIDAQYEVAAEHALPRLQAAFPDKEIRWYAPERMFVYKVEGGWNPLPYGQLR